MDPEQQAKADDLENRLRLTQAVDDRRPVFIELSHLYVGQLHADSIKWAKARGMKDPTRDGPEALSRSFIILNKKLEELDFEKQDLLYYFRGRIWSELSHIKSARVRSRERYEQLAGDFDLPSADGGPEEHLGCKEQLRQAVNCVTTSAQRRILQAGMLKEQEGYSWDEAARAVGWEGSRESLRTSFARLKKEIRERIDEAKSHSAGVHSKPR